MSLLLPLLYCLCRGKRFLSKISQSEDSSGQQTWFFFCSSLQQCKAARERAEDQASWWLLQGAGSMHQMDTGQEENRQKEKRGKDVKG